jgi:hypothetical protein
MSQKWIRSKRWDDEHIPRALWPVKFLLRAFSSIPMAVVLLTGVAVYGALASVPIGLIAAIPTYLLVGLTALGTVAVVAGGPAWIFARLSRGMPPAVRFPVMLLAFLVLAVSALALWRQWAWPLLRYDPGTGSGFMLFADFVNAHRQTTLRRLPLLEMSELEFYAWWPLRLVLLLFVVNLVVATVRRIEFTFPNLGVLMVHTGIVTIALGSVYYASAKQEGDMLLRAGPPDARGTPSPGPIEDGFYDRIEPVLWVGSGSGRGRFEQRSLRGLPRYNDYGLNALGTAEAGDDRFRSDMGRTLRMEVGGPDGERPAGVPPVVGPDVRFEVVGYAAYAELVGEWAPLALAGAGLGDGEGSSSPMREIELVSSVPDRQTGDTTPRTIGSFRFVPGVPSMRWTGMAGAIAIEYTRGMSAERWADLTAVLPKGASHALVVEVPSAGFRQVYGVEKGTTLQVGQTGYTLEVRDLLPQPPMPIITPGYEEAQSSLAIVRVTPPATGTAAAPSGGAPAGGTYERWVYHRFPEISQDLLDEPGDRGMPRRRAADPSIRIAYLDATAMQVYFDEAADGGSDPAVRAIIRLPGRGMGMLAGAEGGGGDALVLEGLRTGSPVVVLPVLTLKIGQRWEHSAKVEVPRIVPASEQRREAIGTHQRAAIAVRVSSGPWSRTVWVPFSQYLGIDDSTLRRVTLPDGRELTLAFGRRRYTLPGLRLRLVDFEMIPYPHSDTPRDYRSDLVVYRRWRGEEAETRSVTSLNYPLKASPFIWSSGRSWIANALDALLVRFSPLQYKFSQAGWDQGGWRQTRAAADRGELARPFARFTILGVGNNPGIYVIAGGAVLMSVGIPWAFYLKPVIVRARKRRIQRQLALAGRAPAMGSSPNGQGAEQPGTIPAGAAEAGTRP